MTCVKSRYPPGKREHFHCNFNKSVQIIRGNNKLYKRMRMQKEMRVCISEFIYRSYWPLHEVIVARPAPVTFQGRKINLEPK